MSVATLLVLVVSTEAVAQRREASGIAPSRATSRAILAARPAARPAPQPPAKGSTPSWSILGGIATGDGPYDLGLSLGGTGRWSFAAWPAGLLLRGDAYFAHHGGDVADIDLSLNILGVGANVEYNFPSTSSVKPYVLGGLGLYYSNANADFDSDIPGIDDDNYGNSSTDLGLTLGGGLAFSQHAGVELRLMDIDNFTTIPIVFVWRF